MPLIERIGDSQWLLLLSKVFIQLREKSASMNSKVKVLINRRVQILMTPPPGKPVGNHWSLRMYFCNRCCSVDFTVLDHHEDFFNTVYAPYSLSSTLQSHPIKLFQEGTADEAPWPSFSDVRDCQKVVEQHYRCCIFPIPTGVFLISFSYFA